jgi:hypothetical protein
MAGALASNSLNSLIFRSPPRYLCRALQGWEFYQAQIRECDEAIAAVLRESAGPDDPNTMRSAGSTAVCVHVAVGWSPIRRSSAT